MMSKNPVDQYLREKLLERERDGLIRSLKLPFAKIDFTSNDYLGIAHNEELHQQILKSIQLSDLKVNGSGGSRLLSGNSIITEEFETWYAQVNDVEAALLFNSGYDANVALLSCIAQRSDTIISDELVHASIIDGMRLSYATRYKFKHNSIEDLEAKLKQAKGNIFVVVESVYSMDGDIAPLIEIAHLCRKYQAALITDEAHAIGIKGNNGKGLSDELGLSKDVFARVHTFGKAAGYHGACILGSSDLKKYLINFARPFIYSTALPPQEVIALRICLNHMHRADTERKNLQQNISSYNALMNRNHQSPIIAVMVPGNENVKNAAAHMQDQGFDVRPILSPTVAEGTERLRIIIHSNHAADEIEKLCAALKHYVDV